MNFNLREHAWLAPIGSFIVATVALGVAVIANKTKLKEAFKAYWKLLVVIFGLTGIWVLYLEGWLDWLKVVKGWFLKRTEIPIWALWLICISAFTAPVIIWGIVRKVKNVRALSEAEEPLQQLDPRHYTQDIILGVLWKWTYHGKTIQLPDAYCPAAGCGRRLDVVDDFRRSDGLGFPPASVVCPRCRFRHDYEWPASELPQQIAYEIERLFSTNQWRERLSRQLMQERS